MAEEKTPVAFSGYALVILRNDQGQYASARLKMVKGVATEINALSQFSYNSYALAKADKFLIEEAQKRDKNWPHE